MLAATRFHRIVPMLCLALAACSGSGTGGSTGGSGSTGQGTTGVSTAAHGSGSTGGSSGGSTGGASACGTATVDFGGGAGSNDFVSARFDASGRIGPGIALPDGGVAVLLGTSAASACAAVNLQTPAGATSADAVLLTLDPSAASPGVHAIQADGGGPVQAFYFATLSDGQGNGTGGAAPGISGAVTVAAFDGGSIAGSFDVTFASSGSSQPPHVIGDFESSGCGVCL